MTADADTAAPLNPPPRMLEQLFAAVERWRGQHIPRDDIGYAVVLGAAVGAVELAIDCHDPR